MAGLAEDWQKLERLQELDNILENGADQFNNSPIAAKILEVRAKKAEYKVKRDQLDAVYVKARDEVAQVSAKDSQLAEAQQKMQKEIEATQGDYKKVEAYTNKLNELTNQRKAVDEKLETIEANFNKIKQLKEKVDDAIGKVGMQEDDLNEQLQRATAQLKIDMEKAQVDKANLEKEISMDALALYKKQRNLVGQIVLAKLDGDACSICKSTLSNANLSKVQEQAPISECPSCHRVLWIH